MLELDHVVIGASDLDLAIQTFSDRYGLKATKGGQHPDLGTHNALIGAGDAYIELLAPLPGRACAIAGLKDLSQPALFHYALRTPALEEIEKRGRNFGLETSGIQLGQRKTTDGQLMTWRILFFRGHCHSAVIPFFIDWQETRRPSDTLPPQAQDLTLSVTAPAVLRDLFTGDVNGVDVKVGKPSITVDFTANGQRFSLSTPDPIPVGL